VARLRELVRPGAKLPSSIPPESQPPGAR